MKPLLIPSLQNDLVGPDVLTRETLRDGRRIVLKATQLLAMRRMLLIYTFEYLKAARGMQQPRRISSGSTTALNFFWWMFFRSGPTSLNIVKLADRNQSLALISRLCQGKSSSKKICRMLYRIFVDYFKARSSPTVPERKT